MCKNFGWINHKSLLKLSLQGLEVNWVALEYFRVSVSVIVFHSYVYKSLTLNVTLSKFLNYLTDTS